MGVEGHGGMVWTGEAEQLGETPIPVPICPPQITYGLNRT
jgi:hypothetical protein